MYFHQKASNFEQNSFNLEAFNSSNFLKLSKNALKSNGITHLSTEKKLLQYLQCVTRLFFLYCAITFQTPPLSQHVAHWQNSATSGHPADDKDEFLLSRKVCGAITF